ncbi:MAG: peroxide stress protein YaaA [Bacteroidetes bacterium]|nr:peroxide stress protein YaaA [Bacteroidota bacterium]
MKILLSPAKSLDYKSKLPTTRATQPLFLEEAALLNKTLEKKTKKQLAELMHISEKLAALNYQRFKDFELPFTSENARPAIYAYAGDVYEGFDAYSLSTEHLDVLQDSVRILTGMYGMLRPLDLIQPYRLEMGTKLGVKKNKDLYGFWKDKLTAHLNAELKEGELLINLASVEYAKAINEKELKVPFVSPVFKDFKNGNLKVISFYAKKARGQMARFAVENRIEKPEDLKAFDIDGYSFSEEHTQEENSPVFIR